MASARTPLRLTAFFSVAGRTRKARDNDICSIQYYANDEDGKHPRQVVIAPRFSYKHKGFFQIVIKKYVYPKVQNELPKNSKMLINSALRCDIFLLNHLHKGQEQADVWLSGHKYNILFVRKYLTMASRHGILYLSAYIQAKQKARYQASSPSIRSERRFTHIISAIGCGHLPRLIFFSG